MTGVLLALTLSIAGLAIISIKDIINTLPIVPTILMFTIDGMIIYLFYKMNVNKEDIAFGILIATILKVFMFAFTKKENK